MTLHKFSFKMHWALGTTQEFQVLEGYTVSKRARLGVAEPLQHSSWASFGEGVWWGHSRRSHEWPLVHRGPFASKKTTYCYLYLKPCTQLDGFFLFFAWAQGGVVACLGLQGWPTSPCGDILGKVKAPSIPVSELSAGE